MPKQLVCKECGDPRDLGRRLCRPCDLKRLRALAASRPRYMWSKECEACKKTYTAWRKNQHCCSDCVRRKRELAGKVTVTNKYVRVGSRHEHRVLAELLLGRKLHSKEVVHHMDHNPKNNSPENLLVLSRSWHNRLHQYLDLQRVIIEKSVNENSENCWKALIVPMTTAWLVTTSAKVQKLSEIG
jgi:hypothetical protein